MIGTLFSAKQLVRRIQNQLIKIFEKQSIGNLTILDTYDIETTTNSSVLHKPAKKIKKLKMGSLLNLATHFS